MRVIFDGLDAVSTQFVSSTTLDSDDASARARDRLGGDNRRAA